MDIYEAIGYELFAASAITNIVGSNIYHGMRPEPGDPCINYFEVGYVLLAYNAIESPVYQISCRASTPAIAQQLAREVAVLFQSAKRAISIFDIQMATVDNKLLLYENETELYHVPVDVRFVYEESIVS